MSTKPTREMLTNLARPVDLSEAVARELERAQERGITLKAIAADSGIPLARIYAISEGRSQLYLAETSRLMRAIQSNGLLEDLAGTRGAIVVYLQPIAPAGHQDVFEAFAKAAAEMADVPRTYSRRIEDGSLTPDDALVVAGEIDQWIQAAMAMKDLVLRKAAVERQAVGR